jgi:hypothetical protein
MLSDAYTQRPEQRRSGLGAARVARAARDDARGSDGLHVDARPRERRGRRRSELDPPRTAPVPLLTTERTPFKIIFGGINGVSVTGRSTSLNAPVVTVQRKLAALAAEYVLENDLALPDGQRKLMNGVTGDDDPATPRRRSARRSRRSRAGSTASAGRPDSPEVNNWFRL